MSDSNIMYKLNKGVKSPFRGPGDSAGLDLFTSETKTIEPGHICTFHLGIRAILPKGTYGKLEMRSSMGKQGLMILAGVLDRDYTGEISAMVVNVGLKAVLVSAGTRIVQLVCVKCVIPEAIEATAEEWAEAIIASKRGDGCFGSTGQL